MSVALLAFGCLFVASGPTENPFLQLDPLVGNEAVVVAEHGAAYESTAGPPLLPPGTVVQVQWIDEGRAKVALRASVGWIARSHLAAGDEAVRLAAGTTVEESSFWYPPAIPAEAERPDADAGFRPGRIVVLVTESAELRTPEGAAVTVGRGTRLEVEGADGEHLLVRAGRVGHGLNRGRVRQTGVIPSVDAVPLFDELLRSTPTAEYLKRRALCHLDRRDLDAALADCNSAVRLERTAEYLELRAGIRAARGERGAAVSDLHEALSLDPDYANAYQLRGVIRVTAGDLAGGLSDLEKVIGLAPEYGGAYGARGGARMAEGRWAEAVSDLDLAARLDSDNVGHWNNRGICRLELAEAAKRRGEPAEAHRLLAAAEADFREAARLVDDIGLEGDAAATAHQGLARVAQEAGRSADAVAGCLRAVRYAPDSGAAHGQLAVYLAALPDAEVRDGRRAVRVAAEACKMVSWGRESAVAALAAAYAECGEPEAAAAWQRRAAELAAEDRRQVSPEWIDRFAAGERRRLRPVLPWPPAEAARP